VSISRLFLRQKPGTTPLQ